MIPSFLPSFSFPFLSFPFLSFPFLSFPFLSFLPVSSIIRIDMSMCLFCRLVCLLVYFVCFLHFVLFCFVLVGLVLFVCSFVRSFVCLFVCLFVRSFVRSFVCLFVRLFVYYSVYLFTVFHLHTSFAYVLIHLYIYQMYSFVHLCIYIPKFRTFTVLGFGYWFCVVQFNTSADPNFETILPGDVRNPGLHQLLTIFEAIDSETPGMSWQICFIASFGSCKQKSSFSTVFPFRTRQKDEELSPGLLFFGALCGSKSLVFKGSATTDDGMMAVSLLC